MIRAVIFICSSPKSRKKITPLVGIVRHSLYACLTLKGYVWYEYIAPISDPKKISQQVSMAGIRGMEYMQHSEYICQSDWKIKFKTSGNQTVTECAKIDWEFSMETCELFEP